MSCAALALHRSNARARVETAMTSDVLLIPNFGAEEGAGWGAPAYRPADEAPTGSRSEREIVQRTATRLWQSLFASGSRCLGESETAADGFWPKDFGIRNPQPIFSQLDVPDCAVAWLNTPAALQFARRGGMPSIRRGSRRGSRGTRQGVCSSRRSRRGDVAGLPRALHRCCSSPTHCAIRIARFEKSKRNSRAGPAWTAGRFTLKPRFGTSGRGRVAGQRGPRRRGERRIRAPRGIGRCDAGALAQDEPAI